MTLDDESLEKQIRDASLSLEISKINYNNAVTVSKDQVSITRAKNTYDTALKDYENTQVLFDSGAVSQRELDQAELAFDEAKLAYESTLNATSTTDNSLKIASLELESAENRLSDLINSREDTQIRASITGQITSLNVAQGDLVSPSIPLATIETTKALEITTYIGEYDINMVHIDQEVSISGYGVGDNVYEGRVTYIGASAQVQSVGQSTERSVLVKIDIIGDTTFKPNFTADVDIEVAKAENAKAVPYEAIDYRDGENYIFRVVEGKAQMLPVTLGVQGEIYIEVISDDLAIGDEIVLDPPSSLVEGNNIVVIEGGN